MSKRKKYTGLSAAEVASARAKYGSNVITPAKSESWFRMFLDKFNDPLIIILMIAGLLSVGVSFYEYKTDPTPTFHVFFEPIGIFVAILIATGLSFFFEYKASKEFNLLNRINDEDPVTVIRSGNASRVPRSQIVVGDIVLISAGAEVPADGRLLESTELSVDESTLTGEPLAHKSADPDHQDSEATYPSDLLLRGTKAMEGNGVMKVTAVGDNTECGKVMIESGIDSGERTPLDEQMARLGKIISYFAYCIALIVVAGRIVLYTLHTPAFEWLGFINYMLHTLMIAVALLVMAVPEGLPMSVTLSLAYSMRRLLKSNNLVRKLNACETMGATTVICTDKTGTLTQNRMQVQSSCLGGLSTTDEDKKSDADQGSVDDKGLTQSAETPHLAPCPEALAEAIAVNSTAELDFSDPDNPEPIGNPTEGSLLLWIMQSGYNYLQLRAGAGVEAVLPFSTERKYMAVVADSPVNGGRMLFVKGAPEMVMAMCSDFAPGLTKELIDSQLSKYQRHAMRTLAFASMPIPEGAPSPIDKGALCAEGLRFDGIVGISDPLRGDVKDAVARCRRAGIDVKIVTGDNPSTAKEIARQIGLWSDADTDLNIITGQEIGELTDEQLAQRAPELKIIARARPMDKKRLVAALRSDGNVVAVTGDGTNDAPALKGADVGLSMGDGTAVAKQASDITIIDNSFASIVAAVMWGRSLYRNIQRFILFQLTVNVVACITVVIGSFFGTDAPLTVTQMLWVNLIMDTFAAVALSTLPPSPAVMFLSPRRRSDSIMTPRMWWFIGGYGLYMAFLLLIILFKFMNNAEHYLTTYEQTLFFTTFVMMQFWNMFNAKAFYSSRSPFDLHACGEFTFIAVLTLAIQVIIVNFGGSFFSVCPISLADWLYIFIGTFVLIIFPAEIFRRCFMKIPQSSSPGSDL